MKRFPSLLTIFVSAVVYAQSAPTKYVILSPKSNLDTATISEGLAKSCPNVVITENDCKADFVLEASNRVTYSEGDSYSHWHFTLLSKDGDVLMTTHPERHFTHRFKHHFETVCKYINSKANARASSAK